MTTKRKIACLVLMGCFLKQAIQDVLRVLLGKKLALHHARTVYLEKLAQAKQI
jgi:hypothetical protein